MTRITIRDEAERRALEAVLWHEMRPTLDPNDMSPVGAMLHNAADDVIRRQDEVDLSAVSAEVDEMISTLLDLRASIDRLRAIELGGTIETPVSAARLAAGLAYVKEGIEEYAGSHFVDGGFWNQAPAIREQLIRSRDGAVALLTGLQIETVA